MGVVETDFPLREDALIADVLRSMNIDALPGEMPGEGLGRLLAHMDNDMGLPPAGKQAAYDTVRDLLLSRTGLFEDRQRYPGLAAAPVERPIFVTGLPRSGTTLLHSLLAADPDARAPEWWESLRPSPPPGLSAAPDDRLGKADQEISEFLAKNANILRSHPYFDEGGRCLMECEALAITDFRHILRAAYYRVPGVIRVGLNTDPAAFYRYHRKVLQALQWNRPKKRWALKGTEHHVRLDALKGEYPDAIVIWLHRDPQKVFPSVMELLTSVAQGVSGHIDRPAFGREVLNSYAGMLAKAMDNRMIDHPDVHHLRYADFVADPVGAIGAIYARCGLPFGPAQADAMTAWKDAPANRGDRHGKFTYNLDDFGMTRDDIEGFAADYRARFDIPFE